MFNRKDSYVSIHNHSIYSNTRFGDAVNTPDGMLDNFHKKGLAGFALTDHQSLSGHIPLLKAMQAKRKKDPHFFDNFKVLLGDEIYLCDKNKMNKFRKADKTWHSDRKAFWDAQRAAHIPFKKQKRFTRPYPYPHFYHFIMVANNNNGYKLLQKINHDAWTHSFKNGKGYKMAWRQQRLPTYKDDLAKLMQGHKGDLTVSTACLGSETSHDILSGNKKDMHNFLGYLDKTFGKNNTYFELMPNKRPKKRYMAKVRKTIALQKQNGGRLPQKYQKKYGRYTEFNQWYVNKNLVDIAKKTGHKYIISTDSHFTDRSNEHMHARFLKAESPNRDVRSFYHYAHMFTPDELKKYFPKKVLQTAFKNSRSMASHVHNIDPKVVLGNKRQQAFTNDIGLKSLNVSKNMWSKMLKHLRKTHEKITDNVKHLGKYINHKEFTTNRSFNMLKGKLGLKYMSHVISETKPAKDVSHVSKSLMDNAKKKVKSLFNSPERNKDKTVNSLFKSANISQHHKVNTSHHNLNASHALTQKRHQPGISKNRQEILKKQNKFIKALRQSHGLDR